MKKICLEDIFQDLAYQAMVAESLCAVILSAVTNAEEPVEMKDIETVLNVQFEKLKKLSEELSNMAVDPKKLPDD